MNIYLTQKNGKWNSVTEGPFDTKEEVKAAVIRMIRAVSFEDDAIILDATYIMVSSVRVGPGKNIRNDWVTAHNAVTESVDSDVRSALAKMRQRIG